MVRLFDAWGVHLHGIRLTDGSVGFTCEVGLGFTPEGALEYIRRYHRLDPRAAVFAIGPAVKQLDAEWHIERADRILALQEERRRAASGGAAPSKPNVQDRTQTRSDAAFAPKI